MNTFLKTGLQDFRSQSTYISNIDIMNDILQSIYPFCREARNEGNARSNGTEDYPNRVKFIITLLEKIGIEYIVDSFNLPEDPGNNYHNIILLGSSPHMIIAHHDIIKANSDNANDNSASVINAIYLKTLVPDVHVVLTDCEEVGMKGARRLADQIKKDIFGKIKWVLNLELTGSGGENFIIGNYHGPLSEKILNLFDPPMCQTPPSDCIVLQSQEIDSNVINSLPILKEGRSEISSWEGFLDNSSWYRCHTQEDSLDHISTKDMHDFVTKVLVPIVSQDDKIKHSSELYMSYKER